MKTDGFTAGELALAAWQLGQSGNFKTHLFSLIARADDNNRARLARGFPGEVAAFEAWSKGDLGARLRAAGFLV